MQSAFVNLQGQSSLSAYESDGTDVPSPLSLQSTFFVPTSPTSVLRHAYEPGRDPISSSAKEDDPPWNISGCSVQDLSPCGTLLNPMDIGPLIATLIAVFLISKRNDAKRFAPGTFFSDRWYTV
jgi:hypothetical protein